ncbi:MAG: pitrilysin family protein [Pseudomonadota bacterium]
MRVISAILALTVLLGGLQAKAEPQITTYQLENGMDVVVIEDHRAPVVTHMVWYRVGAADEPPGKSGIAHFLEHLMFKGTESFAPGEFQAIVSANGGRDNAFTGQDFTAYHQTIAADRLELVMRMESDRMTGLVLTEDHVVTERDVILEERNQRTDNSPQALFAEQMQAALYLNHPYGVPIIGWRHEMEELSLQDALDFYDRFYAPDNAILVVAGDVDPGDVLSMANVYYGSKEPSGNPPASRPTEPPQLAARRLEMSDPRVAQPYVTRSYLVPAYNPAEPRVSAALSVLSQVLGSGRGSRLSRALELEQGIALGTGTSYSAQARGLATFSVYGVPVPGHNLASIEAALDVELFRMVEAGPDEAELNRAKRQLRASQIFAQDSPTNMAQLYGAVLALGFSVDDVRQWSSVVDAVTPEDVKNAAAMLTIERSVTGWMLTAGEDG